MDWNELVAKFDKDFSRFTADWIEDEKTLFLRLVVAVNLRNLDWYKMNDKYLNKINLVF